ncbi:MAG: response regulator transcription factor [Treponema sp.]|jgi:NarL family two-component system response regulator LiaR|nr:response regulator transcription factor [Treponema sp.]
MKTEILLIEDHPATRHGFAAILSEAGRYAVAGQAGSLAEAEQWMARTVAPPSLIILDLILGAENGMDFLAFLKTHCAERRMPPPPVLVCSVLEDPFTVRAALNLGAKGYVSKSAGETELREAIETALRGETYVSKDLSLSVIQTLDAYAKFTKRELQVISQLKQRKTNDQIARALGIDRRTVLNHISHIYDKTGFSTREQLLTL